MPFHLRSSYGPSYEINRLLYIGRDQSCAIRPPDNLVSRVHACVWLDRGVVRVRDERSSNGTFVNGTRLASGQARLLQPGDQLQVGETLYTFQGTAQAADLQTLIEPPVVGTEPLFYAPSPYAPAAPPTELLPQSQFPPPPAQYGAAPAAPPPAARPSRLPLLLGGCAGVLTILLCAVVGILLTPFGRQWLAGLIGGG